MGTIWVRLGPMGPNWAISHTLYTHIIMSLCMSPSSIIWYRPNAMITLVGKVTVGLVVSNSSPSTFTGFMTKADDRRMIKFGQFHRTILWADFLGEIRTKVYRLIYQPIKSVDFIGRASYKNQPIFVVR